MNDDDRAAIIDLFQRLREVEGRSGPRDPEAEALIRSAIAAQPGAPYYLAQTIVVQNAALREAERRIAELESDRGVVVDAAASDMRRNEREIHAGAHAPRVKRAVGLGLAKEKLLEDPA